MANIHDKLNKIISAIFGKDVRQALYDGLDLINKETESTTAKQKHLEDTFDQLVINSGNSNAEIVDARVSKNGSSFEKLGDRLDTFDSHLEQIENNKAEKKSVASLEERMDAFVAVGETSDNAETVDVRISANGLVFNSAGEHVREISEGLIDLSNSPLKYNELYLTPLKVISPLEPGHIASDGTLQNSNTRVRSKDYIEGGSLLTIINKNSDYSIIIEYWDKATNNWIGYRDWSKEEVISYQTASDRLYKFLFKKNDNSTITVRDIENIFFISPNTKTLNKKIVENISTNDITYDKRTRIGESCNIIIPNNSYRQFPNLDVVNKKVTFYKDTILILGKKMKVLLPTEGHTDVYFGDIASSAIKIYYNFNTEQFEVMNYATYPKDENCVLVCSLRTDKNSYGYMSIKSPYTVNGELPYDLSKYALKTDIPSLIKGFSKSVAHQGYNKYAPNHTIVAYIEAKKHGFDAGECDVQWTLDGIPVLCHDETIDATSDGTGKITEMTYEQLLQYDFGSWKGEEFKGTKIPTFYEYANTCKLYGLEMYVEIKYGQTKERVEGLIDYIKKINMINKCTFICNNNDVLVTIKNYSPSSRLGYVVYSYNDGYVTHCKNVLKTTENEVFIDLAYAQYNENVLNVCRENGIGIELWTTDDKVEILEFAPYVDGITSNHYTIEDAIT